LHSQRKQGIAGAGRTHFSRVNHHHLMNVLHFNLYIRDDLKAKIISLNLKLTPRLNNYLYNSKNYTPLP
jgi:hypothetical protein